MITVFREDGKPLLEIESEIEMAIILAANKHFDPTLAACAGCGAKGSLVLYCAYARFLSVLKDGVPKHKELELDRHKCGICGKTHVIAPGEAVIPYMRHSLGFVFAVIDAYVKRTEPVRDIAERFQIAVSTLYDWVKRFREHYELLMGRLAAAGGGIGSHIGKLRQAPAKLLFDFTEKFKRGFMQAGNAVKTSRCFTLGGFLIFSSGTIP